MSGKNHRSDASIVWLICLWSFLSTFVAIQSALTEQIKHKLLCKSEKSVSGFTDSTQSRKLCIINLLLSCIITVIVIIIIVVRIVISIVININKISREFNLSDHVLNSHDLPN